jgi:hypothetical protein
VDGEEVEDEDNEDVFEGSSQVESGPGIRSKMSSISKSPRNGIEEEDDEDD